MVVTSPRGGTGFLGGFLSLLALAESVQGPGPDPVVERRARPAFTPHRVLLPFPLITAEQHVVHEVDVRRRAVVGQADLRGALHHDVLLRV